MISKRDLLVGTGKYANPYKILDKLESLIITEANQGNSSIKYRLPDNFYTFGGVSEREIIIHELEEAGYAVNFDR